MGDINIKFPSLEEALDEYFLGPPGTRPQLNLFPDVTRRFEQYIKKQEPSLRLTPPPKPVALPSHYVIPEVKTVSVVLRILWTVTERTEYHLAKALESPQVRQAILKALNEQLKRTLKTSSRGRPLGEFDNEASKQILQTTGSAVFKEFKNSLKTDPTVLQLRNRLERIKRDFLNHTSVGVWVNENMTLLKITAAVLAVGGGVLLYHLRPGDKKFSKGVNKLSQFASYEFSPIGSIQVGGQINKFIPRERTVDATITAKGKWSLLPTDLKVSGAIVKDKAQSLSSNITVWLTPDIPVYVTGNLKLQKGGPKVSPFSYRIGLGFKTTSNGLNIDVLGSLNSDRFLDQIQLKSGLNYSGTYGNSLYNFQFYGNYSRPIRGRGREVFSLGFNFRMDF